MAGVRAAGFVMCALAAAFAVAWGTVAPAAALGSAERVWGNGTEWQLLMPGNSSPPLKDKTQPFYVIAPIDPANPQSAGRWGFGPHDSVMNVRPRQGTDTTGMCAMVVVVPGPNGVPGGNIDVIPDPNTGAPLVRAADVDGDGVFDLLTSTATVETAAHAGLVALFQPLPGGSAVAFTCPVRHMVHE